MLRIGAVVGAPLYLVRPRVASLLARVTVDCARSQLTRYVSEREEYIEMKVRARVLCLYIYISLDRAL